MKRTTLISTTTNQLLFKQTIMAKAKTKEKRVAVISPDGFEIEFEHSSYKNFNAAMKAFKAWAKRYEHQGHYSSAVHGRIHLLDLEDFCEFKEV